MKNFLNKTILLFVGIAIASAASYVGAAWNNAPVNPPPADNVATPLNVGTTTQNKDGSLTFLGFRSWGPATIVNDPSDSFNVDVITPLLLAVNGPVGATEYCNENGENCSPEVPVIPNCSDGQILIYKGNDETGYWACGEMNGSVEEASSTGIQFAVVSSGDNHSCGIATNGDAYCWGYNAYGQVGDNTVATKKIPTKISSGANSSGKFLISKNSIAAGNNHTCAVGTDYKVYCWGYNATRELGDGTVTVRKTPVQVLGLPSTIKTVYSSSNFLS